MEPALNVETATTVDTGKTQEHSVPGTRQALNVETPKLPACHVCVVPLEDIVFDKESPKITTPPLAKPNDLPVGQHFTRSRVKKTKSRSNRKPRKASLNVHYSESEELDSTEKKEGWSSQTICLRSLSNTGEFPENKNKTPKQKATPSAFHQ